MAVVAACWVTATCTLVGTMSCTAERRASGRDPDGGASSVPASTAAAKPPARDPLATTELTTYRRVGELETIIRGPSGSTLLQFTMATWRKSAFRIYDRHWRPVTPLLLIDSYLEMSGAVPAGFIGTAGRTNRAGESTYHRWIIIEPDGTVRETASRPRRGDEPQRLRPADLPLQSSFTRRLAYRPSTDAVFVQRMPGWFRTRATWWWSPTGSLCTADTRNPRVGGELRTSTDAGQTWRSVSTSALSPATGPAVHGCEATRGQVSVTTGDSEYLLWVHTLDRETGALIASHELGGSLDPYNLAVLHDGTLVAHTNRAGLMVGATPQNYRMVFRPGPGRDPTFVVGRDLIETNLKPRTLRTSRDGARTWVRHDLAMPR